VSKLRLAVFASGRGSNLEAILLAIDREELNAEVVLVVSDKQHAGAFEIAQQRGVPCRQWPQAQFSAATDLDGALLAMLRQHNVDLIALAGYLKKVSSGVVAVYKQRIVNIHPALLPAFGGKGMYGMNVHRAVIEQGCKVSGVTVHLVDDDYDTGPPVLQRCVVVEDDDTPESLAARVLEMEHRVYPAALQLFAEGQVKVSGRRVRFVSRVCDSIANRRGDV